MSQQFISEETIEEIAIRAIEIKGSSRKEIERSCWMAVHEYHHGVVPTEYDIREIDEGFYLKVLAKVKEWINPT